jgi:hypothetical protein
MTPKEFEIEFDRRIRQLNIAEIIYPVATKVRDDMQQRIFEEGINGAGRKIGTYSRKAAYFSKKQFKKTGAFRPQGKREYIKGSQRKTVDAYDIKSKKKVKVSVSRGNTQRTSMYLPNGYKELKAIQGYKYEFVNFAYSNQLRNQFGTRLAVNKNRVILQLDDYNANKTSWLEDKYGKESFKHTEAEKDFFAVEVTKKLIQQLGDA